MHECYTLQALSFPLIPRAFGVFKSLLAPDGKVLLIARARGEDEEVTGPPWPLPPSVFDAAKAEGLTAARHRRHRRDRAGGTTALARGVEEGGMIPSLPMPSNSDLSPKSEPNWT